VSITTRIKQALTTSGKSQADLARFLNTRQSTVTGWVREGRVPSADSIVPICEFTGVSFEWLLTGKGDISDESVQERELLNAFRALPPAGREVALKQVVALADAFGDDAFCDPANGI
jgi:transcriptional regulator with XRE-family HTH domain